jgi:thiol-disulfide isomerase/thioredoxin
MTIRHLIILIILGISQNSFALDKGQNYPQIKLKSREGNLLDTDKLKGNIIYIDFWASWCIPCKKSLPWLSDISRKYSADGFKVIAINLDTNREDAEKLLAAQDVNFQLAFDPEGIAPEAFEISEMPTSFLIDRSGKVSEVFKGFNESDKKVIEKKIENLIREKSK